MYFEGRVIHDIQAPKGCFWYSVYGRRLGFLNYEITSPTHLHAIEIFVEPGERAKSLAHHLFEALVHFARENHYKIGSSCRYIVHALEDEHKYQDVLDGDFKPVGY